MGLRWTHAVVSTLRPTAWRPLQQGLPAPTSRPGHSGWGEDPVVPLPCTSGRGLAGRGVPSRAASRATASCGLRPAAGPPRASWPPLLKLPQGTLRACRPARTSRGR
eukprot:2685277-Lingulodinium_polyedra.AAC.1